MCEEQCGEDASWCWGLKGFKIQLSWIYTNTTDFIIKLTIDFPSKVRECYFSINRKMDCKIYIPK